MYLLSDKPKYSILVPTRGRAHLLRHALEGFLAQESDDYEVIVCDNWSNDGTEDVVKDIGNSRIRYIRPDRPLSMPENWEYALGHARGEWITVSTDRCIYLNSLLDRVTSVIEDGDVKVIAWRPAAYYLDNWYEPALRGRLEIPACTGKVFEVTSRETLEQLFALREGPAVPKMLNSICHRSVLETARQKLPVFFFRPNPDYAAAVAVLTAVDRYAVIDDVLFMSCIGKESIGYSGAYNRSTAVLQYVSEFRQASLFPRAPFGALLVANSIVETLFSGREQMPKELGQYSIDKVAYYLACCAEIELLASNGVDVGTDWRCLYDALRNEKRVVQRAVRTWRARRYVKHRVIDLLTSTARGKAFVEEMRERRYLERTGITIVRGAEAGFSDAAECVRWLETYVIARGV